MSSMSRRTSSTGSHEATTASPSSSSEFLTLSSTHLTLYFGWALVAPVKSLLLESFAPKLMSSPTSVLTSSSSSTAKPAPHFSRLATTSTFSQWASGSFRASGRVSAGKSSFPSRTTCISFAPSCRARSLFGMWADVRCTLQMASVGRGAFFDSFLGLLDFDETRRSEVSFWLICLTCSRRVFSLAGSSYGERKLMPSTGTRLPVRPVSALWL
mmetsp:Transcript_10220/g.30346  ORF Transcript_10220/g.30346 Transcript_10220/m.30346 type:complete len:213 (+) Transcript_10220:84-722(+)